MTACNRCGKCCRLIINGRITDKKCKHLVTLKSGNTLCRIFKKRIGTILNDETVCNYREQLDANYPGCPFNKPGQLDYTELRYPGGKDDNKDSKTRND